MLLFTTKCRNKSKYFFLQDWVYLGEGTTLQSLLSAKLEGNIFDNRGHGVDIVSYFVDIHE